MGPKRKALMPANCDECGAPIPEGGTCLDHFHALLVLEGQVEGAAGSLTHFYTVSCYALQHPIGMNYTEAALRGLRVSVIDALEGRATVADLLERARRGSEGAVRVRRREGDPVPRPVVNASAMTAVDVLEGGVEGYVDNVVRWARSLVR